MKQSTSIIKQALYVPYLHLQNYRRSHLGFFHALEMVPSTKSKASWPMLDPITAIAIQAAQSKPQRIVIRPYQWVSQKSISGLIFANFFACNAAISWI